MKRLFFLLTLVPYFGFSQETETNEIKNTLKTSEEFLKKLKSDSAYKYATTAQKLAETSGNKSLIAQSYVAVANSLFKKGKKNDAYAFGKKGEKLSLEINDIETLLKSYLILGNIHYNKIEDKQAITYYQNIEKLAFKNDIENITLIKSYVNTGYLFLRGYEDGLKNPFNQAEIYFKKAYDLSYKIKENDDHYSIALNIGALLVNKKQYEKAEKIYEESKEYFIATKNLKEQSQVLWACASLYQLWGKNKLAKKNYEENIRINTIPNNLNGLARAHWAYAGYFFENNNHSKAIEEYKAAIALFKKEQTIDVGPYTGSIYQLAQAYKKNGDPKNAFSYLEQYLVYNDSLNAVQNREAFTEIEAKYQTEKKEQEIKLLSEVTQKQKIIYISLLGLVLSIATFLFFGYRNKIKTAHKLNELNGLKSRFFANISHEFRTPLTLIKSPVQSLQQQLTNDNQQKQLSLIEKNSNRMLELVDQLLELSKIDSGHLTLLLKEGNIPSFLNSILEPFEFQAKENKRNFKSNIQKNNLNHSFDKDVIEKIVTNLIANAFKYSRQNEHITFTAAIENKKLKLVVSNTGTQLKKEDLPKLFERFYQKNETQTGAGIGLALVNELVTLYQGKIDAQIENHTLYFNISLPIEEYNASAIVITQKNASNTIENASNTNNELPILLVVDDNPDIRAVLKDIFKDQFYILEAQDGESGLKIALKEIPDCIISDVMMPKMDGFEFTKLLKSNELSSFIPVVLLTAKTAQVDHLEGLKTAADAYLTKPFNHEIVKATVLQLIAERKKLQERYSQELVLRPVDIVINAVDEKFLERLQLILDRQLPNADFSTDDFALEIGMSRMQLYRKLKSLLGVSATEFLRNERLKTAQELFKKGNGNISEIAYSVGFNDMSYFSKCFKEKYHCTPSEFLESSNSKKDI